MLPSTGYFKDIICPFYENAFCERPYCHFRHSKKEGQNNDGIENDSILQQLVSEAVKKVLKHTDRTGASVPSNVVVETTPPEIKDETSSNSTIARKATYNPTPIAVLKKIKSPDDENEENTIESRPRRHIPVPYTPHRPLTSAIKRVASNADVESFNIINTEIATTDVKYLPGSHEAKRPDPYFPQGSGTSNGVYLPGSVPQKSLQAYNPIQNNSTPSTVSYTPTDISNIDNARTNNTKYEPTGASGGLKYSPTAKVKDGNSSKEERKTSALLYEPVPHKKPKFPCFSSDEDEPKTKKVKAAVDLEYAKHDMNGLDDLEPEFEILGQILDEEDDSQPSVDNADVKTNDSEKQKTEKSSETPPPDKNPRHDKQKSHSKSDSDKHRSSKHSSSTTSSRHKSDTKSKDRDIKSNHKSRDHDKEKHKKDNKDDGNRKEKSAKSEYKTHHSSSSKSHSHSSDHKSKPSTQSKHKETRDKSKSSSKTKDKLTNSKGKQPDSKSTENKRKNLDSKKGTPKKKAHQKEENSASEASLIEDYDDNMEELFSELSESDEDAITKECMKIFEEYTPTPLRKFDTNDQPKVDADEPCIVLSKKRVSHTNDKVIINVLPKPTAKPNYKVNAAQAMANRLLKVREYHSAKALTKLNVPNALSGSKLRIAHVPNVSTMLSAKKVISKPGVDKSEPSSSTTTVQTIQRGTNRVAHIPNDKFADRPGVLEPLSSKIPVNLRSTYLNMMIDESLKIYLTPADAYNRAQQEELATSKKCTAIPIYKNSAVLAVRRLRKEFEESGGVKKNSVDNSASKVSHRQVLIGKLNQSSWSIENKYKKVSELYDELKGLKFFQNVTKWVLTEEQLQQNGFPRPHPSGERGKAKIYIENTKQKPPKGNIRPCCRCKKDFTVDKKGLAVVKEECIYHPNNKYRFRGEVKYQCCQQDGSSDGCTIAQTHVFEYVDYQHLKGYVKTLPKDDYERDDYDYGVYALDCEMCYTTHGLDLTRITVIDSMCKIVYETLIKPLHPIIDYNTRYSGITEEQMEGVGTTLLEVQATLLHLFDSKTILVGHSLESDFKALKLIHDTVIDTSVLFPHKMGPPYKRALRNLSSEYLKKIIQNSVDGHDSTEDATVCMELIQWKLKEELKIR